MIGFSADGTADTGLSPSKQLRQERERCRVHYVSSEHPQGHVRNYQTVRIRVNVATAVVVDRFWEFSQVVSIER